MRNTFLVPTYPIPYYSRACYPCLLLYTSWEIVPRTSCTVGDIVTCTRNAWPRSCLGLKSISHLVTKSFAQGISSSHKGYLLWSTRKVPWRLAVVLVAPLTPYGLIWLKYDVWDSRALWFSGPISFRFSEFLVFWQWINMWLSPPPFFPWHKAHKNICTILTCDPKLSVLFLPSKVDDESSFKTPRLRMMREDLQNALLCAPRLNLYCESNHQFLPSKLKGK